MLDERAAGRIAGMVALFIKTSKYFCEKPGFKALTRMYDEFTLISNRSRKPRSRPTGNRVFASCMLNPAEDERHFSGETFVDAAIFGAGVAGLMASITLHSTGHTSRIYERVHESHDAGMGFILVPECIQWLESFGIDVAGVPLDKQIRGTLG